MSELKATQGPWEISHEGTHNKTWRIRSAPSPYTAVATVHARLDKEANAHLIAAAPSLYEALRELLGYAEVVKLPVFALVKARAALAKARGESV